jgi:LacI family transcriptional regulator
MATIKDVAEQAGVSIATVSHVLNNTRRVRAQTAGRVHKAIRELGYTQNAAARNLAVGRSSILGLIISDIENPFFPEVTRAFQDQAHLHGMETIVMSTHYDPVRTLDCVRRLVALQVPGVAVLTSEMDQGAMKLLAQRHISAVYLDLGSKGPLTGNIAVDYAAGIRQAVEHLHKYGHKEVGFIGGPMAFESLRVRRQAFLDSAAAFSMKTSVVHSDLSICGGYSACTRLLARSRPTAIVAANDLMAIGALHCAYDFDIEVPGELSVVGFDDILFAEFTQPALSSIALPRKQLGLLAFQAVWEMLGRQQPEGKEYCLGTHLVVRQSTGLIPKAAPMPAGKRTARVAGGA